MTAKDRAIREVVRRALEWDDADADEDAREALRAAVGAYKASLQTKAPPADPLLPAPGEGWDGLLFRLIREGNTADAATLMLRSVHPYTDVDSHGNCDACGDDEGDPGHSWPTALYKLRHANEESHNCTINPEDADETADFAGTTEDQLDAVLRLLAEHEVRLRRLDELHPPTPPAPAPLT